MGQIVRPANVGFYACAQDHNGRVLIASGPHDAGLAHALVDSEVRPEARDRGLSFLDFGVIRMVNPVGVPLVEYTVEHGRSRT